MAQLLYFASLRENLNSAQEQLDLPRNIKQISELKGLLAQRGGRWMDTFGEKSSLLSAVNQQMANEQTVISNEDEIAFFPPVTGG